MPEPEPEPLLVPIREAAQRLGIGRDSTYELVRAGRIRSLAVGRRRLIPVVELERFISRESGNGSPREEPVGRGEEPVGRGEEPVGLGATPRSSGNGDGLGGDGAGDE